MIYKSYRACIPILRAGGVGVLPTDTIYGLVGSAFNRKAVERIYRLRRRNPKKPMIILIGSLAQLKFFGVKPDQKTMRLVGAIWLRKKQHPGILKYLRILLRDSRPTSLILSLGGKSYGSRVTSHRKFRYLHRGTKTLAFRLPRPLWLRRLLQKTGPLVAPSANLEGKSPARTIKEAKKYFGNKIDFYVDGGTLRGRASRLIKIDNGKIKILRK